MADSTIKVRMEVIDHATKVVDKMVKQLDRLEAGYRKVSKTSKTAIDTQDKQKKAIDGTNSSINDLISSIGALAIAYKALGAVQATISASDEFVSAKARIGLITDEPETMMDRIYQLSQETRSNFMEMSGVVSKMGINVGVGEGEWFGDTEELLKFNELLTKTFKLGGQNNKEVNAAMLQLTQAMSSGRLQGDEFRSMFENSPLYIKYIGEYLGSLYGGVDEAGNSIALTTGQLKELAAQSLITTDIMIDAMFYAADEIETKFDTLPRTFEQRWEQMKNMLLQQSRSMLNSLNSIVDNESFDTFLNHLSSQITLITNLLTTVLDIVSPIIQFTLRHWNIMGPIMLAGISYLGILIIKTELMANTWLKAEIAARKYAFTQNMISANTSILSNTKALIMLIRDYLISLTLSTKVERTSIMLKHHIVVETKLLALMTKHESIVTNYNTAVTLINTIAKRLHIKTTLKQVDAMTLSIKVTDLLGKTMTRVVLPIALFVGLIWLAIKAVNALTGSSYTLAQVLAGTLGVIFVGLYNTLVPLYNLLVDTANLMDRLSGGTGDKYSYVETKKIEEGWAWGDKYANNSVIGYDAQDFQANDVASEELMNGIGAIVGNTGQIASNTGITQEDVSFLRAMAQDRIGARISNVNIAINNSNTLNGSDSRELTGIVDQITKELEESLYNTASGAHI